MPVIRVAFLWHMHQPFYKDLATGEYRLPWVRMHGLKDYYGMVKLLSEFPEVHQTFNLVPSLITQLEDYVSGKARDPFLEIALKPAGDLNDHEKRFALTYLFQANTAHLIGRYPRFQELWNRFQSAGQNPERALSSFRTQDFTDLQVLSQLAWFDEYYLLNPDVRMLIHKGHDFTYEDQQFVGKFQQKILASILPAYSQAVKKGSIEISTSPYYHPILPLICDSDQGRVSSPNLPLPQKHFAHPDDAREQIKRGLELHERVFGRRPVGMWPSEGSVSEQTLAIAHELGVQWIATDEGVLGRTAGIAFDRSTTGHLSDANAEKLYQGYLYRQGSTQMKIVFRDHSLSDLIGFVYSGMPAKDAAEHFIKNIKEAAEPVLQEGKDALIPIILDGENAWEFYPGSGREFLRRVYAALQDDPQIEALSIAEALDRQKEYGQLKSLVPGSWINANFNVWIGAPEDNRAWDYLADARDFYEHRAPQVSAEQRATAFEELMVAEGSDWNWWYGPEHHSANDRDFDELYRKHLSNVYQALGAEAPSYLAQPIALSAARPEAALQTAFIHPRIGSEVPRYFDWIGAAMYTADRHSGAMHGKQFLLDAIYAGIDEEHLYGRLDFSELPKEAFFICVDIEVAGGQVNDPEHATRLQLKAEVKGELKDWALRNGHERRVLQLQPQAKVVLVPHRRAFEFELPLHELDLGAGQEFGLRFSVWTDGLPLDALPLEGALPLQVVSDEHELAGNTYR
ncbi:MAG TPA: glycoside hydrolase family 57 protein [Terriglobales bacterium]|nr:glycoside hydrolase family 57 protein [Terriglobales bacterium]